MMEVMEVMEVMEMMEMMEDGWSAFVYLDVGCPFFLPSSFFLGLDQLACVAVKAPDA